MPNDRNPNAPLQSAADILDTIDGRESESTSEAAAVATACATVALAYEQQTANMIAFYTMSDEDAAGLLTLGVMTRDKFEALAKNIVERLGLS